MTDGLLRITDFVYTSIPLFEISAEMALRPALVACN